MARTVIVAAVKPFSWGGHTYQPGARVAVPLIEALRLQRQRVVTLTKKAAPVVAEPTAPAPSPKRRLYRRRDLQAEESAPGESAPAPLPIDEPSVARPTPEAPTVPSDEAS